MVKIKNYVLQEGSSLVCKKSCEITIDLTNYNESKNIEILEDIIWINGLVCNVEFEDRIFSIILDYPVEIQKQKFIYEKKRYIKCSYTTGSVILNITTEALEIKEQAIYVERLLAGKEVFKNVEHLLTKLLKVYADIGSSMDLVHLECLLSNCLRDRANTSLPTRLGKTWDPILMNIKDIVFSSSFMQGLAFENTGKAIRAGLTSDVDLPLSILEQVLAGTLVEEKEE